MGPSYPIEIPQSSPFGIQNIPFGIFSTQAESRHGTTKRAGVAIGKYALDLATLAKYGLFNIPELDVVSEDVFIQPTLNAFATLPGPIRSLVRNIIIKTLSDSKSPLFQDGDLNNQAFVPLDLVTMHVPMAITDYTDFFSSLVHAENALRPFGIPIPSAFYEYPMGYNGRLSSIDVSGAEVVRPCGFFKAAGEAGTAFQPSAQLDFEVEMGAFISLPVNAPETVTAKEAADHIFGYVLLNDWSARDIQKHEMAPFGPLHSKSFRTSISPWIVTLDALKSSPTKPPPVVSSTVSSLLDVDKSDHGIFDIDLIASVSRNGGKEVEIVRSNMAHAYWSPFQMAAYQSSSGCGLNTGDLLGSGTLSSPDKRPPQSADEKAWSTFGCLAEINATRHKLPDVGGGKFQWLEDGDRLTIEGWFKTADGGKSGFGGVTGLVLPANLH